VAQNTRRNIHGRADSRYAPRILDLQTIERIWPVYNFMNAQIFVDVFDNFRE